MNHTISPLLKYLGSASVLFQAWKKTEAYIRSHNWYADTLELDWQALRLPDFIADIQKRIASGDWNLDALRMVPAPKSESWETNEKGVWQPCSGEPPRIRPLAHVSLEDQVLCTAIMLCLADRVESKQCNPDGGERTLPQRKKLLSYGHRLFCHVDKANKMRHAWASKKLYRQYYTDYRRFLARPEDVAKEKKKVPSAKQTIAIVTADISRFYDRVRPALMRDSIRALQKSDSEIRFFDFVCQLFDWPWAQEDVRRAKRYADQACPPIASFDHVALPQGLVSAGFFANIALLRLDDGLSALLGAPVTKIRGVCLLDACRYVDDLRFVLEVPETCDLTQLEGAITQWINGILRECAPGLLVEDGKTKVVVDDGKERFVVPQSRAAERIQHEISGGFDLEQGMNIIGALEGFIHAQHHYSPNSDRAKSGLEMESKGISDMKDETAARFTATRYRNTFRSLRPLLDAEHQKDDRSDEYDDGDLPSAVFPDSVVSREQFDERGLLFVSGQLGLWEANPAHVRLMRIAVDLFPRPDFCSRILTRLRPAWSAPMTDPSRREVHLYCLSELFRAGATETGIVSDLDLLPDKSTGVSVAGYHDALLAEGREILVAATKLGARSKRFPWYLLQQILLYLATRQESLETLDLTKLPGASGMLKRYIGFYRFYAGASQPEDFSEKATYMVMAAQSFGEEDAVVSRAAKHPTIDLLRAIAKISPSLAVKIWQRMTLQKKRPLVKEARFMGLSVPPFVSCEGRVGAAELAGLGKMVWQEEYNLVALALGLFEARRRNRKGVLTPWRVRCEMQRILRGPVDQRIVPGSVEIVDHEGGEVLFELPDWCEKKAECIRFEVGQVLRYLLTGSVEFLRPVPRAPLEKNLPQYRRALSNWELGRYATFNGRSGFGPDWLPLSDWAGRLLIGLLRWPGCGTSAEPERTTQEWIDHLSVRFKELEKLRGDATGMLFLEQEARLPYKAPEKWERPLRLAIVQTVVPDVQDLTTAMDAGDLELDGAAIRKKHRNHLRLMLRGVRKMLDARLSHLRNSRNGNLDWLILPELAVHPDDVVPLLMPVVRHHKCIVLVGLVYHAKDATDPNSKLINSALWLIPEWSAEHGLQISRIEQGKEHLAANERRRSHLLGYRPAQWIVRYYWSSDPSDRPLLLSAAVCFDATDTGLAHDLRNRNDFFAICALNRDTTTYDNLAITLNYHLFQGVLVVNNGEFGGSNFHAPLRESYERKVIHFHGQAQASIGFAEISPRKFVTRHNRSLHRNDSPKGEWKTPPAGWTGPEWEG